MNNGPGSCRCGHLRSEHTNPRLGCGWSDGYTGVCACTKLDSETKPNRLEHEYPTVHVETECPVDPYGQPADLRTFVLGELDRILAELNTARTPIGSIALSSGLIPRSMTELLRDTVRAWPNVKLHLSFNEAYPEQPFVR